MASILYIKLNEEIKNINFFKYIQSGSSLTEAEITHLKGKFETITSGNGMSADDLKEIYRIAQVEVTDAQIEAQVIFFYIKKTVRDFF